MESRTDGPDSKTDKTRKLVSWQTHEALIKQES